MQIAVLTVLAVVAFAANALLARWALGDELLDPASFASLRAVSAAVVLAILVKRQEPGAAGGARPPRDFLAAAALAVFLLLFSYAYVTLDVGSGALILFAAAQLTILAGAHASRRQRPRIPGAVGFAVVAAGVIYFTTAGDTTPPRVAALTMAAAGIGAGVHALRVDGRNGALNATSRNMTLAVIPVLAIHVVVASTTLVTLPGILIAVCAGAITTAGGFVAWHAAKPRLEALRTAIGQVAVPFVALLGGIVLLGETPSTSLVIAALVILGGALRALTDHARQIRDS